MLRAFFLLRLAFAYTSRISSTIFFYKIFTVSFKWLFKDFLWACFQSVNIAYTMLVFFCRIKSSRRSCINTTTFTSPVNFFTLLVSHKACCCLCYFHTIYVQTHFFFVILYPHTQQDCVSYFFFSRFFHPFHIHHKILGFVFIKRSERQWRFA